MEPFPLNAMNSVTSTIPEPAGQTAPTLEFTAYFTKGLGDVAADELREILGPRPTAAAGRHGTRVTGDVDEPGERFVTVRTTLDGAYRVLTSARTVDDFRLLVAGPCQVASEGEFKSLCSAAAKNTEDYLTTDPEREQAPWSVTVSARNPVWSRGPSGAPSWAPAPVIAEAWHGADVAATVRSPVDLRLQADGEVMHVATSLGGRPPGKRADDTAPRRGALRPTVAAAMVRMALAARPQDAPATLYDPFAGTGTIVAEAWRMGLPVFASDVDPGAVEATRERLARLAAAGLARRRRADALDDAALSHRIFVHDVCEGAAARVRAGLVVGNIPWGKQVAIPSRSDLFDGTAAVAREAVAQGGVAMLLTTHEDQFAARLRRALPDTQISTRRIGLLGQTPAIVMARPATGAQPDGNAGLAGDGRPEGNGQAG
jgi:hypothetical protein